MRHLKILLVFLIIFSACNEQVVEPMRIRPANDYLIYEKVLEKLISDQNAIIVLDDSTHEESSVYANPDRFIEGLSGLSAETLENYMSVNQEKIKLKNIPNIDFVFASKYEYSSEHKIYVNVSRIGYNKKKTQAVVTMGMTYGPFVGYGSIMFLVKDGYEWKIQKTMMTWIS
jgi:hypothetical protein